MNDYFTVEEFRRFCGEKGSHDYADTEIKREQGATIEMLERWAHSAWPNVTGSDGDGEAADYRSIVETFDGGNREYLTDNVPVVQLVLVSVDDIEQVELSDYWFYPASGIVKFASYLPSVRQTLRVQYKYGFAQTPDVIKSAVMSATRSRLDPLQDRKKIPQGTRSIQSRGTIIDIDPTAATTQPWPWDTRASADVVAYWGRDRPRRLGVAGR